jgi:hypothetical protein
MAPEVMEGKDGIFWSDKSKDGNSSSQWRLHHKADIWSFGITALELGLSFFDTFSHLLCPFIIHSVFIQPTVAPLMSIWILYKCVKPLSMGHRRQAKCFATSHSSLRRRSMNWWQHVYRKTRQSDRALALFYKFALFLCTTPDRSLIVIHSVQSSFIKKYAKSPAGPFLVEKLIRPLQTQRNKQKPTDSWKVKRQAQIDAHSGKPNSSRS